MHKLSAYHDDRYGTINSSIAFGSRYFIQKQQTKKIVSKVMFCIVLLLQNSQLALAQRK